MYMYMYIRRQGYISPANSRALFTPDVDVYAYTLSGYTVFAEPACILGDCLAAAHTCRPV